MVWVRRTRITLLVVLLCLAAALSWLASHPSYYAGQVGRLLTVNVLREAGATFSCGDLEGNPLSRMVFRDVTVTRGGGDGSFLYLTADSLVVGYDLGDVWRRRTQLNELVLGGVEVLLRRGSTGPAASETTPGAGRLPGGLRMDRLALLDVDVQITGSSGEVEQEFRDFFLELSARSHGDAVEAVLSRASVEWVNQDVRLRRAQGSLRLDPPRYEFNAMSVETDSIRATGDALVIADSGLDSLYVDGQADYFLLSEMLRAIGHSDTGPRLFAEGEAVVTGSSGSVRIEAQGRGTLDGAPVVAREFVGVTEGQNMQFESMVGQYRSARGRATGRLEGGQTRSRLIVDGNFEGADASDPWTGVDLGWPATDLSGRAHVELALGDSLGLQLGLTRLRGVAATLPVDEGELNSEWNEADGFRLRSATVQSMGTSLQADGSIGSDDTVSLRVQARADSLAPWARRVFLPIAGERARFEGRLTGRVDSLQLDAAGTVDVARTGGLELEQSQVFVRVPRVFLAPGDLELQVGSPRLDLQGQRLGAASLLMTRNEPVIAVHRLSVSRADTALVVRGTVLEEPEERFLVNFDSLGARWGQDEWNLVQGRELEVGEDFVRTDGLVFESGVGRVAFRGGIRPGGQIGIDLDVTGGDLNLVDRLGLIEGIRGGINGSFRVAGTLDSTVLDIDAEVDSLRLPGRSLDVVRMKARASGREIELDQLEFVSAIGSGSANGRLTAPSNDWVRRATSGGVPAVEELWRGASLDLEVRPEDLDVSAWADPLADPGGFGLLTADLEVRGPTTAPRVHGELRVDDYPAPPFRFPTLQGHLEIDGEGLLLEEATIDLGGPEVTARVDLPLKVSLVEAPTFLAEDGVDVRIESPPDMDLSTLPVVWPDLRRTSGKGNFEFHATGDPRAPELRGSVRIRDGEVQLVGWSEWLRDLEVDGTFGGQKLFLQRIQGREGLKGKVQGDGQVVFRGLLPDDISLDLDASRILISSVPLLQAIASGDDLRLRLERPTPGAPRAPTISGSLVVDKARYTGEFEADPTVAAGVDLLGPNAAPPWMLRLRIKMKDQVRVSNSFAELRVVGDVDVIRDPDGFRIRGTAEIPTGRVSLVGTEFRLSEGTMDFSRRPVVPEIDITALTEVPVRDPGGGAGRTLEEVTVRMTGTFEQPHLEFSSRSGLNEAAILGLLAGVSPDEAAPQTAARSLGLRAGLNLLQRTLAREIRGIDTVQIETPETGADEARSTRIALGKYLTDSVYVRYAQGLVAGEQDVLLEYQMSRRTLISGEAKSRLQDTGLQDEFNIDFKWRIRY